METNTINLKEQVLEDLKTSMKSKNTLRLESLRAIKSSIDKYEKENPGKDVDFVVALKPLIKQRKESAAQFESAGNFDLANKELAESIIIMEYLDKVLPPQLDDDAMRSLIDEWAMANTGGLVGKNDIGKIMAFFKSKYDGQYDGKRLSELIKAIK